VHSSALLGEMIEQFAKQKIPLDQAPSKVKYTSTRELFIENISKAWKKLEFD
jgi:hypothetical protein